jgi:hypothetical protein
MCVTIIKIKTKKLGIKKIFTKKKFIFGEILNWNKKKNWVGPGRAVKGLKGGANLISICSSYNQKEIS